MTDVLNIAEGIEHINPVTVTGADLVAYRNLHLQPDRVFYLILTQRGWRELCQQESALTILMECAERRFIKEGWHGRTMEFEVFTLPDDRLLPVHGMMGFTSLQKLRNTHPVSLCDKVWIG